MNLTNRITKLENKQKQTQQSLNRSQSLRLFWGLGVFLLLVFSQIAKGFYLEWMALGVLLPLFIIYFKISRNKQAFYNSLEALRLFYVQELQFQQGILVQPIDVERMSDSNLARDLDMHYVYSQLQRCLSIQGGHLLDEWLCQKAPSSLRHKRQLCMQELTHFPGLLRKIQLRPVNHWVDFSRIAKEVSRSFFPENISWKWIVPISWVTTLILIFLPLPALLWKISLFTYIASMLTYLKYTGPIFSRLQDLHQDFTELSGKIASIERLAAVVSFFPHLKKAQVSQDVAKMDQLISLMSVKTNPILFYLLNLILPWDFFLAERCEKARIGFEKSFNQWSPEIIELEALGSLANLNIYHNTTWAEEKEEEFISFENLSHPLTNQDMIVKNDFNSGPKKVFIITGSNMSGKSTFLRAVGINFCLAQIGAPVFAKNFFFQPRQMVTCIRVSDSLRDGQSYFYAEVKRMKKILETAEDKKVFFLIDEPLRGTNNKERLIGNQKYLTSTIKLEACGFISTHDLELTQLAQNEALVDNYHFSEKWDEEDLVFDYKIKEGPSKSTNALKILAREGLY